MQYMNKIKKGKLGLKIQPYYNIEEANQNKGKINLLDNLMFPIDIDKSITEYIKNSIKHVPEEENIKNSIKHVPEEETIKETITNKKAIGPSTILAGTELINNLAALKINKNIAKGYKDN